MNEVQRPRPSGSQTEKLVYFPRSDGSRIPYKVYSSQELYDQQSEASRLCTLSSNSEIDPVMRAFGSCMAAPTVVGEKYTIRMRSRYAAALVLLDWYLMVAPPLAGPPGNAPGNAQPAKADVNAPLSRWTIIKIFPSQKACEAERAGNAAQRCLEANDPRFRENNRENEHGPLTPAKSGAPT